MPSTGSQDDISNGLRELTEAIVLQHPELHVMGLFGGTFGYGAKLDNDVFMMHPYCWCEHEGCQWCAYDEAKDRELAPNFHHKKSGFKVWWYKYIGRGMRIEGMCDWPEVLRECLGSIVEVH